MVLDSGEGDGGSVGAVGVDKDDVDCAARRALRAATALSILIGV